MKKLFNCSILFILLVIGESQAQIGINTVNPTEAVDVNGSVIVTDDLNISSIQNVNATDDGFKLLVRKLPNALAPTPVAQGQLVQLDPDRLAIAPINVANYHFTNISSDNITDVNTRIPSSLYLVGIANFSYTGDAINKALIGSGPNETIGDFTVRAFEDGGTWHLEIKNRELDLPPGDRLEYRLTLVIYARSFFRGLPDITHDMGNSYDSVAGPGEIPNLPN
ncbi:hypothetical protein [Nonlabens xiamenensis]|uniref:hypothetical protein n=1 Tax=Nonlabens xiamenensis TaxID=2341043 RepID=UPI000F605A06|nr:hypothetical protein [Nonlabens xiamenensis]